MGYLTEAREEFLREKAILIIARKGWSSYVWKRVMNRFIKCIERF
jgi:hypothetical protein|tara:strand:- start:228 stop:362 length:135 start_codon:yes stop_codon:yes gene_type:complete